ncbi:hypothetical protein RG903_05015 [Thermithiobacillus tepidarius DSM 3134]|uniref:hypothetical protein n=1 Tax=Thermithiobacillus tepidarius TaxID=929 RepID=UPI00041A8764|nr:hypothetical protein [Thermithiobacillus tepidarius]
MTNQNNHASQKLAQEIARWRAGRPGPARRPEVEYRRRKRQAAEAERLDFLGNE